MVLQNTRGHMNIKAYIDQFHEISHLKREQQFVLLEKARNDASSQLKGVNFSMLAFLLRTTIIAVITGGSYLIFGYSAGLFFITLLLSLLLSTVAVTEINTHLLSKSLKKILLKEAL